MIGRYLTLKDKLNGDFREKFDAVEKYGVQHRITQEVMAEKLMDLLDTMLQAQENGTPAEKIVGDAEEFGRNLFSDQSIADVLRSAAKWLIYPAWCMLATGIFGIIVGITDGDGNIVVKSSIAFGVLVGVLGDTVADVLWVVLSKLGCRSKKAETALHIGLLAASIMLIIIVAAADMMPTLKAVPVVIISAVYLAVYYAVTLTMRYRSTGSLKAQDDGYNMTFSGLVKEEVIRQSADLGSDVSIVKSYAKRYIKVNKRRERSGKNRLTTAEFFQSQNRQNKLVLPVSFAIGAAISLFFADCESAGDRVFFLALLAGVFVLIWLLFRKLEATARLQQSALLAACEENNVELDEYYERLLSEINKK